jgi:hypothetical protein
VGDVAVDVRTGSLGDRARRTLDQPRPSRPDETRSEQLARWTHWASLAVVLVVLLVLSRHQWFDGDDWFFAIRVDEGGVGDLFRAYNVHWVTIPLIGFGLFFRAFRFRSYVPYLVPVIVLHVVCGHLLWRLLRQVGVDGWVATALVPTLLFSASAATVTMLGIQTGGTGSLALGLVLVMLVNRPDLDRRRTRQAAGLGLLSLPFSGVAPVMIGVATLTVVLRRGWRAAVPVVALPAGVYVAWAFLFGRTNTMREPVSPGAMLSIPRFVWTGLVATVDESTVFKGAGVLVVVALTAWAASRWDRASGPAAPAFAMAVGGVAFYLLTGFSRVSLFLIRGVEIRYVYFAWALVLPIVGLALTDLLRRWAWRDAAAVVLGGVLAVHGLSGLLDEVRIEERREMKVRTEVLASARVVTTEASLPDVVLYTDSTPGLTGERLARYQRAGYLDPLPSLTPAQYVVAALPSQGRFQPKAPAGVEATPGLGALTGATAEGDGGCLQVTPDGTRRPELTLFVSQYSKLAIRAAGDGTVTIVRHAAEDPEITARQDFDLEGGRPVYLVVVPASL